MQVEGNQELRGGKGLAAIYVPRMPSALTVALIFTIPLPRCSKCGVPTTAAAPVILPRRPRTAICVGGSGDEGAGEGVMGCSGYAVRMFQPFVSSARFTIGKSESSAMGGDTSPEG